ncbi:MAG: hypothetical protein Q4G67_00160 [Actinomycetia bacterium]|nr:hypothetical protein [Actinomycetes bacterium]
MTISTKAMWFLVLVLAIIGGAFAYLGQAITGGLGQAFGYLSMVLVGLPFALAVNITMQRRRAGRREDAPDSVEHHAAQHASAVSFRGSLLLVALLIAALAWRVQNVEAVVWGFACLAAMTVLFWVAYGRELGKLRG